MPKHKVKLLKWIEGVLKITEHEFPTRHAAQQFATSADCHSAKIVNENGNVVHEVSNQPTAAVNTYA
jgi:hypothetical protein